MIVRVLFAAPRIRMGMVDRNAPPEDDEDRRF
jgi:hypothetical protein